MDPRYRRSREALRAAVYELAAVQPVTEITVTELCRVAGVTKDTFYRHASSPLGLLADMLSEELEAFAAPPAGVAGRAAADGGLRAAEHSLLEHVATHAEVYRAAMRPQLTMLLRSNLERIVRDALIAQLHERPEIIPSEVDRDDEAALRLLASYAASGTVGAIESWLAEPELDVDRGVRLILAASPRFWLGETAPERSI
ncbi:MAG TPA: hypothetical protein VGC45_15120 [Gryllotalpicola sp.]